MNLNKLRDEAYAIAKMNGWHNEEHSNNHWLMLVISEIAEAVNADRNNNHADIASFKEIMSDIPSGATLAEHNDWFKKAFENHVKNTVEDELSDVVIRCLDLAGLRGIDLTEVNELLSNGMKDINETFPEVMYYLCSFISSEEQILDDKLNYCMALIIGYCKQKDIDIEFFIEQKMKYNRLREYKHGNKKY